MSAPNNTTGLLTLQVVEGFGAVIQPSTLPVLLEYEGIDPTVCRQALHVHLEDPQLAFAVDRNELKTVVLGTQGPAGTPGRSGDTRLWGIEPAGAVDGVNSTFVTPDKFVDATESLFLNGVLQRVGGSNDYLRSESVFGTGFDTIQFTLAPRSGDIVSINYDVVSD